MYQFIQTVFLMTHDFTPVYDFIVTLDGHRFTLNPLRREVVGCELQDTRGWYALDLDDADVCVDALFPALGLLGWTPPEGDDGFGPERWDSIYDFIVALNTMPA